MRLVIPRQPITILLQGGSLNPNLTNFVGKLLQITSMQSRLVQLKHITVGVGGRAVAGGLVGLEKIFRAAGKFLRFIGKIIILTVFGLNIAHF